MILIKVGLLCTMSTSISVLLALFELSCTEVSPSEVMVSATPLFSILLKSGRVSGQLSVLQLEWVLTVVHWSKAGACCGLECLIR